jgi:hypothetical protein
MEFSDFGSMHVFSSTSVIIDSRIGCCIIGCCILYPLISHVDPSITRRRQQPSDKLHLGKAFFVGIKVILGGVMVELTVLLRIVIVFR